MSAVSMSSVKSDFSAVKSVTHHRPPPSPPSSLRFPSSLTSPPATSLHFDGGGASISQSKLLRVSRLPSIKCSSLSSPSLGILTLFHSVSASQFNVGLTSSSPIDLSEDQFTKFKEAAKKGNLVPLYRCVFSDHLTPILAYRCLVKEDDRDAPSFLFESVEPGLQSSNIVSL